MDLLVQLVLAHLYRNGTILESKLPSALSWPSPRV